MSQTNVSPPNLPLAPVQYDQRYMDKLTNTLRLFFNQISTPGPLAGASINLDIKTLPTQADLATLRTGDVYRDTSASNVLKIKV
jgi:hypothetical protein